MNDEKTRFDVLGPFHSQQTPMSRILFTPDNVRTMFGQSSDTSAPAPRTADHHGNSFTTQRFLLEKVLGPLSDPEDGVGDTASLRGTACVEALAAPPKMLSNTLSTTPPLVPVRAGGG